MDLNVILQVSVDTIVMFSQKQNLSEYEFLAYEQACRTIEVLLKSHRMIWEKQLDELENS